MSWEDDDFSLSGLTQEAPKYEAICESDGEKNVDNLRALFELAKKLAGGQVEDFGDAVFELSQTEKPQNVMSSAISVGTKSVGIAPKVLTYSEADAASDVETIPNSLPEGPRSKKVRYEPELSDVSDSEMSAVELSGKKSMKGDASPPRASIGEVFAKAQARRCGGKSLMKSSKPAMNAPRTSEEMTELAKLSLQPATMSKVKWATRAYDRWIAYRKEIFHARNTASFTPNNRLIRPLHEVAHDLDQLKDNMCDFIVEITKENGEQYPGNTLYDLLQGLSLYLQREKGFSDKLMSEAFKEVRNTLDNLMKERAKMGIGKKPEREYVSAEHEAILWDKQVLGESNPDQLRKTVFFLLGCRLGLRGIKEHYDLRRFPDSQINIIKVNGQDAIIYREFASKTRQGGLKDRSKPPLQVRYTFCSGYRPRCIVELVRKYLALAPQGTMRFPRFYVQNDPTWTPGSTYWYSSRPVRKNTIAEYMKKIMEAGGIEGFYCNHSLRKSTATRLFERGVDPQLIQEQTGHKSNAVMLYKKSNLEMKRKVCDMLNVLPSQMQAIRDHEKVMLESETSKEKKKESPVKVGERDNTNVKVEAKMEEKPQVVVDSKKGLDVHVPVMPGIDLSSPSGLVNIHFHFHAK